MRARVDASILGLGGRTLCFPSRLAQLRDRGDVATMRGKSVEEL